MPRPKRAKAALSTPARVARSTARQLDLSSSDRVNEGSDDSQGIVTTKRANVKDRPGVVMQEATMSGALTVGEFAPTRAKILAARKRPVPSRIVRSVKPSKALEALKARRDAALKEKTDAALAVENGNYVQVPSSQNAGSTALSKPSVYYGEREKATARSLGAGVDTAKAVKPTALTPTGGTALEKSPARGRERVRAPETGPKAFFGEGRTIPATPRMVQATPLMPSSVLGPSNIKRRPRQPSLLRLVQAQAKQQSDDEDEDDDLNDFCPDDESTSFLLPKSQSGSPSPPLPQLAQTPSSRKRKRPSPHVHVPMSQSVEPRSASWPGSSQTPDPDLDEDLCNLCTDNTEPKHEPSLPCPLHRRTSPPPPSNFNLSSPAPPLSSHTLALPGPEPTNPKPKVTRPKSISSPAAAPLSSSPCPSSPTVATSCILKPLSTATLQNLLPRRRLRPEPRHPRGTFDIPSSSSGVEIDAVHLEEDEDELGFHAKVRVKPRARDKATTEPKTLGMRGKGREVKGVGGGKMKQQPQNEKAKAGKTYARKKAVVEDQNDENQPENEDDSELAVDETTASVARRKKDGELKRIAAKFMEVDQWELEIEEVTGSGSSQIDAR